MNVQRLRRVLAIALVSDNQHEVMVAIDMARRILAKGGRDVDWLLNQITPAVAPEIVLNDWREHLTYINEPASQGRLNDWELQFVMDVSAKAAKSERWRPTIKQERRVRSLYMRLKIIEGVFS